MLLDALCGQSVLTASRTSGRTRPCPRRTARAATRRSGQRLRARRRQPARSTQCDAYPRLSGRRSPRRRGAGGKLLFMLQLALVRPAQSARRRAGTQHAGRHSGRCMRAARAADTARARDPERVHARGPRPRSNARRDVCARAITCSRAPSGTCTPSDAQVGAWALSTWCGLHHARRRTACGRWRSTRRARRPSSTGQCDHQRPWATELLG